MADDSVPFSATRHTNVVANAALKAIPSTVSFYSQRTSTVLHVHNIKQ